MRPSWDEYFLEIANLVKTRSTCIRRQIGAVIVNNKHILSTGYNGAPKGCMHCLDIGCIRDQLQIPSGEKTETCKAIHSEQNAIVQAAWHGIAINGSTIYITTQPCILCSKMIINAGIKRVVYQDSYPDGRGLEILYEANIEVEKMR